MKRDGVTEKTVDDSISGTTRWGGALSRCVKEGKRARHLGGGKKKSHWPVLEADNFWSKRGREDKYEATATKRLVGKTTHNSGTPEKEGGKTVVKGITTRRAGERHRRRAKYIKKKKQRFTSSRRPRKRGE